MLTILIAEDQKDIRELMSINLRRAGYNTVEAENGSAALDIMDKMKVHLMIVDIMMPVMDGWQLTSAVRESGETMPIIVVTAKDSMDDKRTGFRSGADDYMVKPVDMEELILRVEALLRRANINERHLLTVNRCVLDEDSLILTRGDKKIELRNKEFKLLSKLLSYPGKIFTRHALMDEIWGYDNESDVRTIDVHIKRLREKLEDIDDFEIVTVRGLGYKAVINKDGGEE